MTKLSCQGAYLRDISFPTLEIHLKQFLKSIISRYARSTWLLHDMTPQSIYLIGNTEDQRGGVM